MRTKVPLTLRALLSLFRPTSTLIGVLLIVTSCQTTTKEQRRVTMPSEKNTHSILDSRLNNLAKEVKEYPKRHGLHYQIAAVHYQKSQFKQSVVALHKAIDLSPKVAKYHYHLGRVYLHMGELEDAEEHFRHDCAYMPRGRYTGPHAALGYTLMRREKADKAIEQFKTCLEIEPENPSFYYFLGSIYDIGGDRENVIRYYREYLTHGGTKYRKNALFVLDKLGVEVELDDDLRAESESFLGLESLDFDGEKD